MSGTSCAMSPTAASETTIARRGDGDDPGRLMERHAEQLVAHLGDLARVNRHPDPDGGTARPGLCRQRALGLDGGRHGVAGRSEDEDAAVAAGGISAAPAGLRGAREDRALPLDDPDEGVAERPEQRRGPLHVGEEQRHDPRVLHLVRAGAAGGRPHLRRRHQASRSRARWVNLGFRYGGVVGRTARLGREPNVPARQPAPWASGVEPPCGSTAGNLAPAGRPHCRLLPHPTLMLFGTLPRIPRS